VFSQRCLPQQAKAPPPKCTAPPPRRPITIWIIANGRRSVESCRGLPVISREVLLQQAKAPPPKRSASLPRRPSVPHRITPRHADTTHHTPRHTNNGHRDTATTHNIHNTTRHTCSQTNEDTYPSTFYYTTKDCPQHSMQLTGTPKVYKKPNQCIQKATHNNNDTTNVYKKPHPCPDTYQHHSPQTALLLGPTTLRKKQPP